ncbi:MAG: hypothetical protein ACXABD_08745 [Candidatus Thorarchaeota archaeon]
MTSSNLRVAICIFMIVVVLYNAPSIGIVTEVKADSLDIIDYDLEGIYADTTQYFVMWIQGPSGHLFHVNASVLEFAGSTGWPQLEITIYDFDDYPYFDNYLATCGNFENYTLGCFFETNGESRYVIAVTNKDPIDDAVYNLTIHTEGTVDYQYTTMFDLYDFSNPDDTTVSVTYFSTANPYLYRNEIGSNTRVVVEWIPTTEANEIYFMIYNKGETCELFVGLLGLPYYYLFPSLTAFVIDFESYDKDPVVHELDLWTFVNYTVGANFTCESGHRYNFWISVGIDQPELHVFFDTFETTELNFEKEFLAENPEGVISLRPSFTDPWVEYQQLNRKIFIVTVLFLKRYR